MSILDMDDLSGVIDPEFLISNGYVAIQTNCEYIKKKLVWSADPMLYV